MLLNSPPRTIRRYGWKGIAKNGSLTDVEIRPVIVEFRCEHEQHSRIDSIRSLWQVEVARSHQREAFGVPL